MLKELAQELNQILIEVETLTNENRELEIEKETINSQLLAVNESLRVALENKTTLEADGLQVGSLQGNTRSYSHYNEIGVYDKTMTLEELIALTQI